jgi:phosphatidylserine synthase
LSTFYILGSNEVVAVAVDDEEEEEEVAPEILEEDTIDAANLVDESALLLLPETESQSLFNAKFIWLLTIVLVAGWMRSVLSTFLPYHLLFDLHQTPLFVGVLAIFRISAETLIFAGWQRPGGFDELSLLRLGLFASVVRVAGYAALKWTTTWIPLWIAVFCLESLKGVSVACVVSGAVRLAHALVPSNQSTRSQAYVSGTYSGLATAVAGVAGGGMVWVAAEHSISAMFAWTAVIGLIFMIAIEFNKYK